MCGCTCEAAHQFLARENNVKTTHHLNILLSILRFNSNEEFVVIVHRV